MFATEDKQNLRDPFPLAVAVFVDRIRSLPVEDREDLFSLTKALATAESDEEYVAAARGMEEILDQLDYDVKCVPLEETPIDELQNWKDFIGRRIKEQRVKAEKTQEELAKLSGLPQSHISRLERGQHSPSFMTVEKIAKALDIAHSELDPSA